MFYICNLENYDFKVCDCYNKLEIESQIICLIKH